MALQATPNVDMGASEAPKGGEAGPGGAESAGSSPLDVLQEVLKGAAAAAGAASSATKPPDKKKQASGKSDNTIWFVLGAILLLSKSR